MKRWEFKKALVKRLKILRASMVVSLRESLAYSGNTWGNLWSTVAYIATFLVFIEAIFSRTQTIAGYSQSELLLLILVVQASFLVSWFVSLTNIEQLSELIRKGDLDLLLIKPLPHLFYVSIRKIEVWSSVVNIVSSVLPVAIMLSIRGGIRLEFWNTVAGIWVAVMGLLAVHGFQFMVSMLIFKLGQAKNLFRLTYELSFFASEVPYEGFPNWFKIVGILLIPCLLPSGLAVSIMLGKTQGWWWIPLSTMVALAFLAFKKAAWEVGLKSYQSASS